MTDALREAATKALEAFDGCAPMREVPMIVEALRAALAAPQAEQPEVVAWMYQHDETGRTMITEQPPDRVEPNDLRRWHIVSALYAAPPTLTPLTDEEMFNVIAREVGDDDLTSAIAAGRAVERAHGIVGGGK